MTFKVIAAMTIWSTHAHNTVQERRSVSGIANQRPKQIDKSQPLEMRTTLHDFQEHYQRVFGDARKAWATSLPACDGLCVIVESSKQQQPTFRCLPRIYVVGFRKCGTSSIAAALHEGHFAQMGRTSCRNATGPTTKSILVKETHFPSRISECMLHNDRECSGLRRSNELGCRANDPSASNPLALARTLYSSHDCNKTFVDASPESLDVGSYFLNAIRVAMPAAKFIAMVRHPPSRLWSDYTWTRQADIQLCVPDRTSRINRSGVVRFYGMEFGCGDSSAEMVRHVHRAASAQLGGHAIPMIARGFYEQSLRAVRIDRRVLVLRVEDWRAHPEEWSRQVLLHIGVPTSRYRTLPYKHDTHGNVAAGTVKLPPQTVCLLEQVYAEPNNKLASMLGNDQRFTWPNEKTRARQEGCMV